MRRKSAICILLWAKKYLPELDIGIFPSALDSQNRPRIQFLGLSEGLAIAEKTLDNFVERAIRLYEQGPGEPCGSIRLGEYVKRWVRWAGVGLGKIDFETRSLNVGREIIIISPPGYVL